MRIELRHAWIACIGFVRCAEGECAGSFDTLRGNGLRAGRRGGRGTLFAFLEESQAVSKIGG
jgi:hypothetical protein